jgi:hypothetical protein
MYDITYKPHGTPMYVYISMGSVAKEGAGSKLYPYEYVSNIDGKPHAG